MRRNKFGGGGPSHRSKERGVRQLSDTTATYFVPSFSVRRHVSRESEQQLQVMQRDVAKRLGRPFRITPPQQLSIKGFEQRKMIERMRELGTCPSPEDMRDVAYDIRDKLNELLSAAPPTLSLPLGRLGVYGYNDRALGMQIAGWKGYRARYGMYAYTNEATQDDPRNEITCEGTSLAPLGTIVEENSICLDSVAAAFEDGMFTVEGLGPMPHVSIATRRRDTIRAHELRAIDNALDDVLLPSIELGDPVIELRTARDEPAKTIYVRNAWESLAVY